MAYAALACTPSQDAHAQPRKFEGVDSTKIIHLTRGTYVFFFDTSRVAFPPADSRMPSADDLLAAVAAEGVELRKALGSVELFSRPPALLKIGDKAADSLLAVVVYPAQGVKGKALFTNPVTFSPAAATSLNAVISKHGQPTEKELWSLSAARDVNLDGIVNWWGDAGVAAAEDGTITHVLVRKAPAKR